MPARARTRGQVLLANFTLHSSFRTVKGTPDGQGFPQGVVGVSNVLAGSVNPVASTFVVVVHRSGAHAAVGELAASLFAARLGAEFFIHTCRTICLSITGRVVEFVFQIRTVSTNCLFCSCTGAVVVSVTSRRRVATKSTVAAAPHAPTGCHAPTVLRESIFVLRMHIPDVACVTHDAVLFLHWKSFNVGSRHAAFNPFAITVGGQFFTSTAFLPWFGPGQSFFDVFAVVHGEGHRRGIHGGLLGHPALVVGEGAFVVGDTHALGARETRALTSTNCLFCSFCTTKPSGARQ